MNRILVPALMLAVLAGAQTALAHHAASGLYDGDGWITVRGRVDSVFWRNPHVRFTLMVASEDGSEQPWQIEAGSVNSLERMGISQDVLEPGETIEVSGLPGRERENIAFARSIVSAEGEDVSLFFQLDKLDEHYELGRDKESADDDKPGDIFRVWVPVKVPNTGSGKLLLPLTEPAVALRSQWDPADDPSLRCEPPGMPAAMDNPYPVEFEDHGDTIVMRLEEWDGVRTFHMNPDPAADPPAPSPMGYSVGRWDGDTLVVETSRIDYPYFDDLGTPQSRRIHITERFDLDADNARLLWTGEIVDPVTFSEPVVLEIEWRYIPGNERKPYRCALPGA
jgi:Family of unknown function (DUF6152)